MFGIFRKPPGPDSTDHAARRILELLEREERDKRELRRLRAEGWRPPADSAPPERRFGDGRDNLMELVQSDLDRRQALADEARRRVQLTRAGSQVAAAPPKSPAPDYRDFAANLHYANVGQSRNVTPSDRAKFRSALDARKSLNPSTRAIFDYVFDFEGGYGEDAQSGAVTGITRSMLPAYLRQFYETNPEARRAYEGRYFDPGSLSDEQRIAFMKWYADTQMGKISLDDYTSPKHVPATHDPKLAGQLFDIIYHYGMATGSREIQRGTNDTLARYRQQLVANGMSAGDSLRAAPPIQIPPKERDRNLGPRTRAAIEALLRAGYGDELRAAIDAHVAILPGARSPNESYRRSIFR
jgi:hypothetical protein